MDVFGGAPRFLAYPRPVVVQSGTDAVLKCQISGDPRPAVIWERNNEKIHPEGRYRVFEDGNVYNLIITSVTKEDSGQYICKAKNCIGETYAAATLKVEGEAQEKEFREENKPRFLIKPLSTRVGRGEDAMFSCKLWGNPRPEVIWEKDGKKLNEIFESTHFTISYQDGGWFQLKIFKTRAPDGGVYTCKARNEFGESLAGAVLLVDAGPGHEDDGNRNGYTNGHWKAHQGKQRSGRQVATRLKDDLLPNSAKVKMFAVTEGKHAKFRCYVTGKPKPEILWRKDGRLILSGRRYLLYEDREGYFTLKVLYCKQQDNGVYVCSASNTAGQTLSAVHLIVKEPPVRFKQPLNDLQVWERDLAVLECEVPEDSVPITWYLEDRRLQPGAKYGMEEWGTKRRLTIRDIGVDDDGIYLCEMADGGRSIAEVAVKGTIVRKLPRKVDVLEGENAAFCVEVEEEEMDIHWYKDGTELRETHQTILKSFGRTHILVFVNTTPQDSGLVMFYVGRSKTSSQLRVKAARHCPPSCPIGVQINTERANAALLSWFPAQDSRKNPPSGYIIERQEVGSQEWLQCLTTDSATSVEILGDSVPCEADYRFRICSVNKYGRSGNVEFPRAVHLVPVARIQAPLQDALVPEGQDACFTIELSASVIGTWFLNGNQLQDDDRFSIRRSRTHQSLRIRGVRDTDNGAEITFIAYGIRDSAALYIQAPLVKFTPLSEMDRNKFVEVGNPIVLYCELSDPEAPVRWYKNGVELNSMEGLHIQSEGTMRRIVIQSADFSHSGVYSCDAIDDVIRFNVEVEAPPVRFSVLPEGERNKSIEAGSTIALQCELSDPLAQVSWYKDGAKLLPQSGLDFNSEGTKRELFVQSAEFYHSGVYSCKTRGDAVHFNVDVKAPPVRFSAVPEVKRRKCIEAGCPIILQCEISDSTAQVQWYKDGDQLLVESGVDIKSDDCMRTLSIQSAHPSHAGVYSCTTKDDVIKFQVEIRAEPVRFSAVPESEKNICTEAGGHFELHCKVSDPTVHVHWFHNNTQLQPETGLDIQSEGDARTLVVNPAEPSHSGLYRCETSDDSVQFTVDIKVPPPRFLADPEVEMTKCNEEMEPAALHYEISDPTPNVSQTKDEEVMLPHSEPAAEFKPDLELESKSEFEPESDPEIHSDASRGTLIIHSPDSSLFEVNSPKTPDDPIQFEMDQAELSHYEVFSGDTYDDSVQCTVDIKEEFLRRSGTEAEIRSEKENNKLTAERSGEGTQMSIPTTFRLTEEEPQPEPMLQPMLHPQLQPMLHPQLQPMLHPQLQPMLHPQLQPILQPQLQPMLQPQIQPMLQPQIQPMLQPQIQPQLQPQLQQLEPQLQPMNQKSTSISEDEGSNQIQESDLDQDVLAFKVDVEASRTNSTPICGMDEHFPIDADCSSVLLTESSDHTTQEKPISCQQDEATVISNEPPTQKEHIQSSNICLQEAHETVTKDEFAYQEELKESGHKEELFTQPFETEVVRPIEGDSPVHWYKDKIQFYSENENGNILEMKEDVRRLNAPVTDLGQSKDDDIIFKVDVQATSLQTSSIHETEKSESNDETVIANFSQPEVSSTMAEVCWYKEGEDLQQCDVITQSEETFRALVVKTSEPSHSGEHACETDDVTVQFAVDLPALPVTFSSVPEAQRTKCIESGRPFKLQCEVSHPDAQVWWYKDGNEVLPQDDIVTVNEEAMRTLSVQTAELCHSGTYSCQTNNDLITFHVEIKAPSLKFIPISEVEKNKSTEVDSPIVLKCELSDATAQVLWCKDGKELALNPGLNFQTDGNMRKLTVQSAKLSDTGNYTCHVPGDTVSFVVDVQAHPVRFSALPEIARNKFIEAGCPIILQCEISDPTAQVSWLKDGVKLQQDSGLDIQSEGTMKTMIIHSAELKHSGVYSCEAVDDRIAFKVDVAAPPVMFSAVPEIEKNKSVEAGWPVILQCEISDPTALVQWYKDGLQLLPQSGVYIKSQHTMRTLVIQSANVSHSGFYSCNTADGISEFFVDVKAPPVTFAYIPEDDLHRNIVEQDNLLLCCQVSRSDATAQWYKDGVELKSSNNVLIEAENTLRKMIILSAQLSDSGTYTCRAGDSALIFKVNVREPPVMIVYPKEDVHLDRYVPEEIVLSCELSRPNGKVTWFKDGQKLQESENIKLKTEGPYRRLKILRSGVEDSGEYVCDTADDSIFFNLNIKEPPVRIVSPSQSQMELCQQTSERMVLSCEISRPNATVRWYRDGLEVEESDSLILEVDGVYRRLIIPKPTVKDSAEYVCDTADDSVTFFVNIAEPPVRFIRPRKMTYAVEKLVGDIVVLECEVSRPNAEVSWKKDGEEIEENSNITITEDGTSRQITIQSAAFNDAGQYVCDARDDVMDFLVKIKDPPLKILRKADIETKRKFVVSDAIVLKCEISRANGVVSWLKDNEKVEGKEHFICEEEGTFRSLIVLSAELRDSGEYICDAQDDKVVFNVTVEEAPVSIVGNSEKPEHHILMTGDELILECEVSRVNAIVQWYCNGCLLQEDSRTHIESRETMRKLVISGLQTSDSGEYLCDATDDKMITRLTVQETPFKFIKKEERSNISAYEEDSVTLRAAVNRVNAPVKWQRGHDPIKGDRFHTTSDGNTHYLTINPLKRCDNGEYTCHVGSDEMHFSVHVKAMKVKFSKPLENVVGLKGRDVVLKCELYKSKGDVQWLKDSQEIAPNRHFTIRADGQVRSLTIHNVTEDDAGEYACESKDERTSAAVVVNIPRIVEFIAELHNITVMEGEDATFKCVVSPEDVKLAWFRNDQPISSNHKFNISSNGLCHMLHINNCQVSDSCMLTAKAEGVISRAILQVQEAQVVFTKSMDPVVAEEFAEATLEVEVSLETAEVQWMRQGVVIHPGSKFTLKQSGKKHSLTVHKLTLSDRGTYSCETLHDCTQAKLSVEPRKIKILKGLTEIQTYERETASFEVELSHSNVEGVWQKDGHALKNNNHCRMTAKGRAHSLTISNLTLDDTGTYIFSVENIRSLARLDVKEIPVSVLKKLEDIRQPEGSGVTLECELSRHNVDIKWTKNQVQLKPGKNHRIYSMGRKSFLQILKCELGDSGSYVCDAGEATTSCSVEIYERELEILQSLEDLDIQEDQNAVFMCEVSLDDVPGEWFKNGETIKPTSTIKIRQEGTKHFLLICNVKGDDSGEIKFVAKNVESTANLEVEALPANIVKPLQDKTALEKTRVILDCTLTNPRCSIRWYKGPNVILPSERFEICSEGCYRKLVIQQVLLEDEGTYSVQVGNYTSSARLTVEAQSVLMVQELQDVDVTAPADACFECEVSLPVAKAPTWTLKGETLHPGPKVVVEKMGTVHRLTLKQTSTDMCGIVCFIIGRAKSTANLRVISNH
ncbi:obscurin-like protein 1 isoform X6 [Rhinichthys klamathensis goyatoka]|uniref:obscurin-like protein 1 isoform X6 n=1 Tax=Rhinichthys klamathensis goyatoka TaxID=3034132 RepID=UPI0024B4B9BA|nr:obscurin-like protein 1 isoform X6 [Rhinichthys klamathensis goyatoka]